MRSMCRVANELGSGSSVMAKHAARVSTALTFVSVVVLAVLLVLFRRALSGSVASFCVHGSCVWQVSRAACEPVVPCRAPWSTLFSPDPALQQLVQQALLVLSTCERLASAPCKLRPACMTGVMLQPACPCACRWGQRTEDVVPADVVFDAMQACWSGLCRGCGKQYLAGEPPPPLGSPAVLSSGWHPGLHGR